MPAKRNGACTAPEALAPGSTDFDAMNINNQSLQPLAALLTKN